MEHSVDIRLRLCGPVAWERKLAQRQPTSLGDQEEQISNGPMLSSKASLFWKETPCSLSSLAAQSQRSESEAQAPQMCRETRELCEFREIQTRFLFGYHWKEK